MAGVAMISGTPAPGKCRYDEVCPHLKPVPMFIRSIKRRSVQVGQHYRTSGLTAFGRLHPVWRVVAVAAAAGEEAANAILEKTTDPHEHKTVALNALLDRRLYTPVADTDAPAGPL